MNENCAYCGKPHWQSVGAINRAQKIGASLYCDIKCAGLGRRSGKTQAEKIAEKRLYDLVYREENLARIKADKKAYFKRTYDPVEAAKKRKTTMPRHVEYCRQPRYRTWKREYDKVYRARKQYGPFWEASILVSQLYEEVQTRMSKYEIALANGTINKTQNRRRLYETQRSTSLVGY